MPAGLVRTVDRAGLTLSWLCYPPTGCMMTLDQLALGRSARIVEVRGDDGIAIRLMEMGLIEGESITLLGRAPLGDPSEFLVQGYRISLRNSEAARVVVATDSSD